MQFTKLNKKLGFTTIELIVTLVIVSTLLTVAVMSIIGIMPTYKLSRGARMIFNTMLSAKSKSVSLNKTYRFFCINETQFKLQWRDESNTWHDDTAVLTLPADIAISTSPFDYFSNCNPDGNDSNINFTSRGVIGRFNSARLDPFLVITHQHSGEEKSVTVSIGGNIKINR